MPAEGADREDDVGLSGEDASSCIFVGVPETEEPAAETEDVAETEAEVEALVEQAGEARELAEEADELDELFDEVVSVVQSNSDALVEREEDVVSADAGYLAVFVPGETLTVPDFRARTSLGNSARYVLDTLIGQGYVQRDWKFGKGIYSLTEAGVLARLGN